MENIVYTKDLTVFQLRSARRALNLTIREVAKHTNLTPSVIVRAEQGDLYQFPSRITVTSVSRLRAFFEDYGIIFLPNNTLRLNKVAPDIVFRPLNKDITTTQL